MTYTLPWGKNQSIDVAIPNGWKIVAEHRGVKRPALENLPAAAARMLAEPTDGPPLAELASGSQRVAIIIDDVGRPTPAHLMAPAVLEALFNAGLHDDQMTVVFAVGTHRPMTEREMREKAGDAVVERLRCMNHDCRDAARLKRVGTTSLGTPVLINRAVAEADLRVLIGTIEPHPQAGFGGGLKNLLPGVAGAASIGHNHLILPSPERWNMIGTLPEQNPMRRDIEEAARMVPGRNFILNTVLGPDLEPVALVAGDAVAAHRRGVTIAREFYGAPLPRRLDAAIVSSFPMDQDLRQGVKGVANIPGAVRTGGAIICFLRCERGMEGLKPPRFSPLLQSIRTPLRLLGARGIYSLTRRLPERVPTEVRFIINFGLQVLKDYHVLVFSPRLVEETGGRFSKFLFDDQEKLFAKAEALLGTSAPEACLIAEGGVSFPVVKQ